MLHPLLKSSASSFTLFQANCLQVSTKVKYNFLKIGTLFLISFYSAPQCMVLKERSPLELFLFSKRKMSFSLNFFNHLKSSIFYLTPQCVVLEERSPLEEEKAGTEQLDLLWRNLPAEKSLIRG